MTDSRQTFQVPSISCEHCVAAITDEVSPLDGVTEIDIDVATKTVNVIGGDRDAIIEAITEAGYDVA